MPIKNPKMAAEECPRFDKCNITNCILHPDYNKKLRDDPSDPSMIKGSKCIPKSIRKRIAEKWGLKHGGLTLREISAQKRWDDLPEEVKEVRRESMRKRSLFLRLSKKGYAITPKNKSKASETRVNEKEMAIRPSTEGDMKENQEVSK